MTDPATLARILGLAKTIGQHWRDQEGVNSALLDELAKLTQLDGDSVIWECDTCKYRLISVDIPRCPCGRGHVSAWHRVATPRDSVDDVADMLRSTVALASTKGIAVYARSWYPDDGRREIVVDSGHRAVVVEGTHR